MAYRRNILPSHFSPPLFWPAFLRVAAGESAEKQFVRQLFPFAPHVAQPPEPVLPQQRLYAEQAALP